MNRRGFFGALVGGIAAATGVRSLVKARIALPRSLFVGRTDAVLARLGDHLAPERSAVLDPGEFAWWRDHENWSRPSVAPQLVQGHAGDLHPLQEAPTEGRIVGKLGAVDGVELMLGGVDDALRQPGSLQHHADDEFQRQILAAEKGALLDRIVTHVPLPPSPAKANARDGRAASPSDPPPAWPGFSGDIALTASLPPLEQVERLVDLFAASGDAAPAFAAALIGELVLTRMRLADLRAVHTQGVPS